MTSEGLAKMFEGDFADNVTNEFSLTSIRWCYQQCGLPSLQLDILETESVLPSTYNHNNSVKVANLGLFAQSLSS